MRPERQVIPRLGWDARRCEGLPFPVFSYSELLSLLVVHFEGASAMTNWSLWRWITASAGAVVAALIVGVPSGIVPTSFYQRMTPVLWWNYPVWIATAILSGLILATYVRTQSSSAAPSRVGIGSNALALLAVGCPVCNKLVIMTVGVTGALNLWAPIQPVLGLISLALTAGAFRQRLKGERACRVRLPVSKDSIGTAVPERS